MTLHRPGKGPRINERGNVEWSTRDLLVGSKKEFRDPNGALRREPDLPLSEKIWCAVIVIVVVVGAVWISAQVGR